MERPLKRIRVSKLLKTSDTVVSLSREEAHYIQDVLRMKKGDQLLVFDSSGNEFVAQLRDSGEAELLEPVINGTSKSRMQLIVAQAIPQHRKMDKIVEQASELGVSELIPLVTEHTIVRMAKEREAKVSDRWQRIVGETLQQSRLRHRPKISPITDWFSFWNAERSFDQILMFHPGPDAKPIHECVSRQTSGNILVLIGPEGGFSDEEVKQAKKRGAILVKMNTGILKTDTAFVAAVSALKVFDA